MARVSIDPGSLPWFGSVRPKQPIMSPLAVCVCVCTHECECGWFSVGVSGFSVGVAEKNEAHSHHTVIIIHPNFTQC